VKLIADDVDAGKFRVGDLDPFLVVAGVKAGVDL
jgi:hypothetical protein